MNGGIGKSVGTRTIYYCQIEDDEAGEVEGMFDENGELLGMWASNDANWRNEYFSPFMQNLGFKIELNVPRFSSILRDKAIEMWG